MQDLTAKRTLVKSPPELWSELSEVERLAKHLDVFGEIKITRLEPESTVAWEGEGASGTVSIEPSGWGTKVTLTARVEGEEPEPEPGPEPSAPEPSVPVATVPRRGWFARLFARERRTPAVAADAPVWVSGASPRVEPEPLPEPEPAPVVEELDDSQLNATTAQAALESALEALGSAHHRPFSRG
jgi:hypothetical protein